MAATQAGEVNQRMWDEALTRVLDLSTVTIKHNAELEARVNDLEVELSVWKQAHNNVVDIAERDKKAHNTQVATLNRQISSLDLMKTQSPLILCAVDGGLNIFHPDLLARGAEGGRTAAQDLTKKIAEYLYQEDIQVFGRLSFWITLFINRDGLHETLLGSNLCTADQFRSFLVGFSQASPRFLIVEVGPGPEAVDAKLREYLQAYTRLPQTLRLFLGGAYNGSCMQTLSSLGTDELLGKLVMLPGFNELCPDMQHLALPQLLVEGLFLPPKLPVLRPGPISLPPPITNGFTTHGGLISPQSETHSNGMNEPRAAGVMKPIDPTKPLHKQTPPPCNEHYLMSCSKGLSCKYSHEWILTPEQLDTLSKNAKKAPCNYLKNGLDCPYSDSCCWGHICPSGSKCYHLSKGKCWFKGEHMHPVLLQEISA